MAPSNLVAHSSRVSQTHSSLGLHHHTSAPFSQRPLCPLSGQSLNHTCQGFPGGWCAAEDLSCPVALTPLPLLPPALFFSPAPPHPPTHTHLSHISVYLFPLPLLLHLSSLRFSSLTLCSPGCCVFLPRGLCSGWLSS